MYTLLYGLTIDMSSPGSETVESWATGGALEAYGNTFSSQARTWWESSPWMEVLGIYPAYPRADTVLPDLTSTTYQVFWIQGGPWASLKYMQTGLLETLEENLFNSSSSQENSNRCNDLRMKN